MNDKPRRMAQGARCKDKNIKQKNEPQRREGREEKTIFYLSGCPQKNTRTYDKWKEPFRKRKEKHALYFKEKENQI
ncbi:MAG: hypothetical protein JW896_13375 [Deltaproteobacteria bacterium]|nr:hypothetical protein [Deltaproteobacteria bacterium]